MATEWVAAERQVESVSIPTPDCVKQHLAVFESGKQVPYKEYVWDCGTCMKFNFGVCHRTDQQDFDDDMANTEVYDNGDVDINRDE